MARIKRNEGEKGRLPVIGHVKTGFKAKDKKHPTSVDYFIPAGKYADSFTRFYGEKPQSLPIVFLEDGPENQCVERYEYRDSSGSLFAKGDGEQFEVWDGEKYAPFSKEEHPDIMERVHQKVGGKGWKVTLTLRFMLPQLQVLGLWQLTTHAAASSIPQIVSIFDEMIKHQGTVKGVIFDLNVKYAKSQKPNDPSRYPVIEIIPNNEPERREEVRSALLKRTEFLRQLKA